MPVTTAYDNEGGSGDDDDEHDGDDNNDDLHTIYDYPVFQFCCIMHVFNYTLKTILLNPSKKFGNFFYPFVSHLFNFFLQNI